jgi:hypothetical protein
MELLLNLFWATLVVPAALIWSRQRKCARSLRHLCLLHSFVAVVCVLVLLFPVISATDDIEVTRGEIEESTPGKRVTEQSASVQRSTCVTDGASARPVHVVSFQRDFETCGQVSEYLPILAKQSPANTISSRAPPVS